MIPGTGWNRRLEFALVLAGGLVVMLFLALRTETLTVDHPLFTLDNDHHKYIYLATNHPFSLHIAPFGWRPLVPVLARLLPLDLQSSFFAIAFTSLWLTGLGLYVVMRQIGFEPAMAAAGTLMWFSLGWATKFNLYDFWLPDAFSFLVITVGIFLVISRRDVPLAIILALGAAAKESTFFVVPLHYSWNAERPFDRRAAIRTILVSIPSLAVLLMLRTAIPALNTDPSYVDTLPDYLYSSGDAITYDLLSRPLVVVEERIRSLSAGSIYAATLAPFGVVVTLLAIVGIRRGGTRVLRMLPLVVLAYVQLLYAPVNSERLLVVAFPVVITMALWGLQTLQQRFRWPAWRAILLSGILLGALLVVPTFTPRFRYQLLLLALALPVLMAVRVALPSWETGRRQQRN